MCETSENGKAEVRVVCGGDGEECGKERVRCMQTVDELVEPVGGGRSGSAGVVEGQVGGWEEVDFVDGEFGGEHVKADDGWDIVLVGMLMNGKKDRGGRYGRVATQETLSASARRAGPAKPSSGKPGGWYAARSG